MRSDNGRTSRLYWAGIFIAAGSSIVHCTLAFLLFFYGDVLRVTYDHVAAVPIIILIFVATAILYVKFVSNALAHDLQKNKRAMLMGGILIAAGATFFVTCIFPLITGGFILYGLGIPFSLLPLVTLVLVPFVVIVKTIARKGPYQESKEGEYYAKKVICTTVLLSTSISMFFFSIPAFPLDAAPIAVSGIILYWFIMNNRRIQRGHTLAGFLLIMAIVLACIPVAIDRVFFRPKKTGVNIVRDVPDNASADIIRTIEGFNTSTVLNWSNEIQLFSHTTPCFSGTDLAYYSSIVAEYNPPTNDPILYQPYHYAWLDYTMNGTMYFGNISTIYTNASLKLRINGTTFFNSNQSGWYLTGYNFLNASTFIKPGVHEAMVNFTSGYLVTLNVVFDSYCSPVCGEYNSWQQWYFLDTPTSIAWIVAFSEYAIS